MNNALEVLVRELHPGQDMNFLLPPTKADDETLRGIVIDTFQDIVHRVELYLRFGKSFVRGGTLGVAVGTPIGVALHYLFPSYFPDLWTSIRTSGSVGMTGIGSIDAIQFVARYFHYLRNYYG